MAKGHSDKLASGLEGGGDGKGGRWKDTEGGKGQKQTFTSCFFLLRGRVQTPANDIMFHIAAKLLSGAAAPAGLTSSGSNAPNPSHSGRCSCAPPLKHSFE